MKEVSRGPVLRQPVRDIVYDRLLELITSGQLLPLEVIREDEVAEWLSVSRHPVREAITRLEANGFVDTRLGTSPRVSPNTAHDAAIRERLVISMLVIAVESTLYPVTDAEIKELKGFLSAYRRAIRSNNSKKMDEILIAFDDAVIASAQASPLISSFRDRLAPHLLRSIDDLDFDALKGPPKRGVQYLENMVKAFEARDADAAVAVLEEARHETVRWLREVAPDKAITEPEKKSVKRRPVSKTPTITSGKDS